MSNLPCNPPRIWIHRAVGYIVTSTLMDSIYISVRRTLGDSLNLSLKYSYSEINQFNQSYQLSTFLEKIRSCFK